MSTSHLFVQNGGTTSQDLGAATTNGVNMPLESQTIADMNKAMFTVVPEVEQTVSGEESAFFGTHVREGIAIVKDWVGSGEHK